MLTKSIHKVVLYYVPLEKVYNIKGSSVCCIKKFALFESEVSPTLTCFFGFLEKKKMTAQLLNIAVL